MSCLACVCTYNGRSTNVVSPDCATCRPVGIGCFGEKHTHIEKLRDRVGADHTGMLEQCVHQLCQTRAA